MEERGGNKPYSLSLYGELKNVAKGVFFLECQ